MNQKFILVSLAVFLTAILVSTSVLADLDVTEWSVNINGIIDVDEGDEIAVFPGETIPIRVTFESSDDAEDVKLKAWISGHRDEFRSVTERFDVKADKTYTRLLSIRMPTDIDFDSEDFKLHIKLETKNEDEEKTYHLEVQRGSYELEILDIEVQNQVKAGETVPITVVVKNIGGNELEDAFVTASIEALNIKKKVFVGDIVACEDEDDDEDECDDDEEDSAETRLFLKIPSDAVTGFYQIEVEAYNDDASVSEVESIEVVGAEQDSEVLTTSTSKSVAVGEEAVYDLIIVNTGNRMQIYNLNVDSTNDLNVRVENPIVTVPADSSRTVQVFASAKEEGTFSFSVDVTSDGDLVEKSVFGISAEGKRLGTASPVTVLTIVLAIIFIVLLIILIVLLTRKPEKTEEFGESYY